MNIRCLLTALHASEKLQFTEIFICNIRSVKLFISSAVMVWWRNVFKWMRWSQLRGTVAANQLIYPPLIWNKKQCKRFALIHSSFSSQRWETSGQSWTRGVIWVPSSCSPLASPKDATYFGNVMQTLTKPMGTTQLLEKNLNVWQCN